MKQKTKRAFASLQNTIKDSFTKLHYYECDKKGLHNGEKLTYVCINKHCHARGLICSICKQDHKLHDIDVIPLKNLLSQISLLKDTLPKQYTQQIDTKEYLEILEKKNNELLYCLKQIVQQLAQYFENLEQEIMSKFQQTKINLFNEISSNKNVKNRIEILLKNVNGDQKLFQKEIDQLSCIMYKTGKKNQIDFKSNIPQLMKQYETYSQKKIYLLTRIQKTHKAAISQNSSLEIQLSQNQEKNKQLINKKEYFIQDLTFKDVSFPKGNNQSKFEVENIKGPISYSFSTLLKRSVLIQNSNTIVVEKNGSIAKQTKNGSTGRFVLVTEGLGLKKQQISFKISRLVHWVGVGICILDKMMKLKYAFQYEKIGHGSYLLSSNGYTWSHSQANENIKNKNFLFSEGQIIDVYLTDQELKFVKRTSQKSLMLKVNMNKNQWNNVCFCVNLCEAQDKVQIVPSLK